MIRLKKNEKKALGLACSRRSDSGARAKNKASERAGKKQGERSDSGARAKNKASERAGKKRGERSDQGGKRLGDETSVSEQKGVKQWTGIELGARPNFKNSKIQIQNPNNLLIVPEKR